MAQIGRLYNIGLAKETTSWTQVEPSKWLAKTEGTITPMQERAQQQATQNRIEAQSDSDIAMASTEAEVSWNLSDDTAGYILLAALGAVSSTTNSDASGSVYDHTFTVDNSNNHPSFTMYGQDNVGTEYATYMMLEELTLTAEAGSYVTYESTWQGKKLQDGTSKSVSYDDENLFVWKHVTIKFASTVSDLDAASETELNSVELTISKNIEKYQANGTTEPSALYNKQFGISGSFEGLFEDSTIKDNFQGDTKRAMRIVIEDTNTTIGDSSNPKIQIDLDQVAFEEWNRNADVDGLINENVGFIAEYDQTNGSMVEAVLTNLTTSY